MLSISLILGKESRIARVSRTWQSLNLFIFARTASGGKGRGEGGVRKTRSQRPRLCRSFPWRPGCSGERRPWGCTLSVSMPFVPLWFRVEVRWRDVECPCVCWAGWGPSEEGIGFGSALFQPFQKILIFQNWKGWATPIKNSKQAETFRLLEKLLPDCLVHKGSSVY